MTLHDELQRIADRAPVADVSPDTWRRARRARTRDRGLVLGAALAAVALVAATVAWLPRHVEPPVASTDSLRVPDHLYAVPDRLSEQSTNDGWTSDAVDDDPAIGTAAAAWLTPKGLPVLVGAADGDYHLLELPGYAGNNWSMGIASLHAPTIALSPDGASLAYSWAEFGPDSDHEPIPSGLRVVDLRTGEVETFPLPGDEGTIVTGIAWSPDGQWLGWVGARMASWTEQSMGGSTGFAGRIDLASGTRTEVEIGNPDSSLGIADSGVMAIGDDARLRFWDGRRLTQASVASPTSLPIAAGPRRTWAVPGSNVVTLLDGADVRDLPVENAPMVFGLGSAGSDLVVSTDRNDGTGATYLVPTDGGSARRIIVVDTASPGSLTLAVDLIDRDHPTVDRPAPDWPMSDGRLSLLIGLGVAAAIAVLLGLRRLGRWVLQRRSAR